MFTLRVRRSRGAAAGGGDGEEEEAHWKEEEEEEEWCRIMEWSDTLLRWLEQLVYKQTPEQNWCSSPKCQFWKWTHMLLLSGWTFRLIVIQDPAELQRVVDAASALEKPATDKKKKQPKNWFFVKKIGWLHYVCEKLPVLHGTSRSVMKVRAP